MQKITREHNGNFQVDLAPPILPVDPVNSTALLKRLHKYSWSVLEQLDRGESCGSRNHPNNSIVLDEPGKAQAHQEKHYKTENTHEIIEQN